jgi:hypothetical protein
MILFYAYNVFTNWKTVVLMIILRIILTLIFLPLKIYDPL